MMISNAVVLNVAELMKHAKYHATFCVYRVPKSFTCTKPEAFTPQFAGLGPYHHCIPQLCFDYLKISALTSVLNNTTILTNVVQQLTNFNFVSLIRDSYDTTIAFKDDTLLYLMTVDALFFYDLLRNSVIVTEQQQEGEENVDTVTKVDLKVSIFAAKHSMPLVNYGGVELTKDAIIRDIFMVENQIPFHILEQIMKVVIINIESEEPPHPQYEDLSSKMLHFCRALCPFIYPDQQLSFQSEEAMKHFHLLDLMYHFMLHNSNTTTHDREPDLKPDEHEPNFNPVEDDPNFNPDKKAEQSSIFVTRLKQFYLPMYSLIARGTKPDGEPLIQGGEGCIYYATRIVIRLLAILILPGLCILSAILLLVSTLVAILVILIVLLLKLFYPVIEFVHNLLTNANLPFMKTVTVILGLVKNIYGLIFQKSTNLDVLVEIPSVIELRKAGIQFKPAYGIVSSSEDNVPHEEFIFYLPKIRLDLNSEVIMRNLVAYESLTQSNSLYLTRYVELMRYLIKTAEDVKVLVHEKIVHTKLSDAQVVQLFNEMNKSIRPTRTPDLDKIIERVNFVFHRLKFERWRKFLIKYVFPIWSIIVCAAIAGCSILLVDLIRVILEGHGQDIMKYISSSVLKVFHWF